MPSVRFIILQIFCPLMTTILTNLVYFSPIQDVRKAVKKGNLGDLNPTPWAFMLGNSCGWMAYSILTQDLWLFFASAPGTVMNLWMNISAAKLLYKVQPDERKETKSVSIEYHEETSRTISLFSSSLRFGEEDEEKQLEDDMNVIEESNIEATINPTTGYDLRKPKPSLHLPPIDHETLVMTMVILWASVIGLVSFSADWLSFSIRQMIVGGLVNLILVFFYAAPLSTLALVIRTQSSASIHIWLMLANTANSTFYTAYGLAITDPYVWAPCAVGVVFGMIQMALCIVFPRTPSDRMTWDDESVKK